MSLDICAGPEKDVDHGVSLHGQPGEGRGGRLSCWRAALPAMQWGVESARQAQAR